MLYCTLQQSLTCTNIYIFILSDCFNALISEAFYSFYFQSHSLFVMSISNLL